MVRLQPSHFSSSEAKHPVHRLFKDRPTRFLKEEFGKHVSKTGSPETFPGIHPGPIPKTARFFKLGPFSIERKKRSDLDMAPCPMCQPNKFLSGFLVWLPELQAIAAIGHCCADKDNLAAADREYAARSARDNEEDYLLSALPRIPLRLAALDQAKPAAEEAERVYRRFRNKGSGFQKRLRSVNRQQGGRLTLTEAIEGDLASIGPAGFKGLGGGLNTRDIEFGVLTGSTALIGDYNPTGELNRIRSALNAHVCGLDEEAAMNYIVDLDERRRGEAVVQLREAERSYEKFSQRLNDFREFFSVANIERINAWSSHPLNPQPFTASFVSSGGNRVFVLRGKQEVFQVVLNPVLWRTNIAWPKAVEAK
jgi:hypothetical protein